ncbi:MAG: TIGR03936 family radical SAM-associated protein, partial [Acidimicrobiales bacterium]|nr:TIGR03936 family radical SAM-associated protein [Acidimicrobiales bacterium]
MKLRIRFTKTGKVRWTSHRDLARIWERVIRRAGLPVAYSQGFSPRPKVHFGLALSTGHESLAEYLDVDLEPDHPRLPTAEDLERLPALLSTMLPVGIDVTDVVELTGPTESLQQAVAVCDWSVEIRDVDPAVVEDGIGRLLAAGELPITRQRKGKDVSDDARPYLLHLSVVGPTEHGTEIEAHLATQPRGLRISELIALLDVGGAEGRVRRLHQWTLLDGA